MVGLVRGPGVDSAEAGGGGGGGVGDTATLSTLATSPCWGLMTEYADGGHLPAFLRHFRFGAVDNLDPTVRTIR